MILIDTSGLLAIHEMRNPYRTQALRVIANPQTRLLSPFVLAELDYLIPRHAGHREALTLLRDIERGVYELAPFTREDISRAIAVIERYAALELGLADASIVVLAERHNCHEVLTADQRHFRTITTSNGRPFHLPLLDGI